MQELDRVYGAGQTARKQMFAKGQLVDGPNCDKTFVALGEDKNYPAYDTNQATPKAFWELRQLYFRNGCLDLPKPSSSPTTSATVQTPATTTSGSPSDTPSPSTSQ